MKSIWLVISSFNNRGMVSVDIRHGFQTIDGPFRNHIYEIFDLFDEYREQLELMRNNLIKAAREVKFERSMIEEINYSLDTLRIRIGYNSCRSLTLGNPYSDDKASLFSSVDESADENESEQMKVNSE
jgi:hypothetical protein